tara:strand:+ start:284 stop:703 length:420 start_codon:yes stop_codon:yes gene_type:complete
VADFETLDAVAALVHRQWSNWARCMLDNVTDKNIARWQRQIDTTYMDLPETQKDSDRAWAALYLFLINSRKDDMHIQLRDQKEETFNQVGKIISSLVKTDTCDNAGYQLALHHVKSEVNKLQNEHKADMDSFGSGIADI